MAKSYLIRTLHQGYQSLKISKATQIPIDEIQFWIKEVSFQGDNFSNKELKETEEFPKVNQFPSPLNMSPVLIVGAGIAGLTAAWRLRKAGVPVEIIEANKRIGGRIQTVSQAAGTSLIGELGAEFIDTDHTYIQSLVKELGLELIDLLKTDEELIPTTFYFQGESISFKRVIQELTPIVEQIEKDLKSLADFYNYSTFHPIASALDQLSLSQYLEIISASSWIKKLIDVTYTVEFGREAEEQSCLNLLYLIGLETEDLNLLGKCDERFCIAGGNEQIIIKLGNFLESSIETETVLESIRSLSDNRYQVSLRQGEAVVERIYERIVLTVPFTVLRHLELKVDLPENKRLAIDNLGYGNNTKLLMGYDDKIWKNQYHHTGNILTDLPFQNIWENVQSQSDLKQGLLTNFTGGSQGIKLGEATPDFQAKKLNQQLEQIFPGISESSMPNLAQRSYWTGELYNGGSYACYLVGQWTQMYGLEKERVGNLFFAGEHCSEDYQACMEGGCETAEVVVWQILNDLNLFAPAKQQKIHLQNQLVAKGFTKRPLPFVRK
ncbi:MAG: flavin monoamine oxidase family protein [Rivularia sp. (in: cyanobacteria)]